MTVEITGKYLGDLRVEMVHGPSGAVLKTDAPTDNQGKGEMFSPTDLTCGSLAACMITIMGIVAKRDNIDLTALRFRAEKHMSPNPPRKIGKVVVEFQMPKNLTADQKKKLEHAAQTCPVHHSLHPDIEKVIKFIYD